MRAFVCVVTLNVVLHPIPLPHTGDFPPMSHTQQLLVGQACVTFDIALQGVFV